MPFDYHDSPLYEAHEKAEDAKYVKRSAIVAVFMAGFFGGFLLGLLY